MCSKLMGFLRFSEVNNLKNLDIILKENHMPIFIEKAKLMYTEKTTGCIYLNYSLLSVQQNCLRSILKPQKLKNQKRNLFLDRFVIISKALN